MKIKQNGDYELLGSDDKEMLEAIQLQLINRVGIAVKLQPSEVEQDRWFLIVTKDCTTTGNFLDAKDKFPNWLHGFSVGWDLARGGKKFGRSRQ